MAIDRERIMNILTSLRHAAGATLLLAGLAGTALAADDLRIDDAWKAALQDQHGVMTEKQHALVNAVAFGAAAALLCDGIDIDPDKVSKAITIVLADGPKELTEDEELARYTDIMLTLGTAKGILLAEGALHKAAFCASAATEKSLKPEDTFWK
jgi:hypothetical protein